MFIEFKRTAQYLTGNAGKLTAYLLVLTVIFVCNFESIVHTNMAPVSSLCSAACQPHTQAEQAQNSRLPEQDKKEPIPPVLMWTLAAVPLALLYLSTRYDEKYMPLRNQLFLSCSTLRF